MTGGAGFDAEVKEIPPNGFLVAGVWAEGIAKLGFVGRPPADDAVRSTLANNPPKLPDSVGGIVDAPPKPKVPVDGVTGLVVLSDMSDEF